MKIPVTTFPGASTVRLKQGLFARFALAVFASVFIAEASGQSIAPVNRDFIGWQKRRAAEIRDGEKAAPVVTNRKSTASMPAGPVSDSGHPAENEPEATSLGLVPTLFDTSYLADVNSGIVRAPVGGFPSSYDLRTQGRLTAVRNQNPYGTCWSFATMASLESWILGKEGTATDFSENHLANLHGFDLGFDDGGNAAFATAYLVRWAGPVKESDDPYPNPGGSSSRSPVRHVQRVVWVPGKTASLDNDAIKESVMERGALYATYYHSGSYYKAATSSYYYPGSVSGNHAVAIVGWNDNYPASNFATKPAGNGAYLVRNSWGAQWGSSGYFWVSYYDGVFARETMYSFCSAESADNYGKIYQYDPLGDVTHLSSSWGANLFTSTGADKIAAVGFYAVVPKTSYSLSIYTGCSSGKPISGTLSLSQTGTVSEPGYVTVPLSKPVPVANGSRFSVVLKLTTPGYDYPHAIEFAYDGYSSGASAASGQSFYSSNGTSWTDLTSWNGTANFCIKAYTESASAVVTLSSVAISGPASVESGKGARYTCTARYSDNSEKIVMPTWTVVSGAAYAAITPDGTLTAVETTVDRVVTIKASYSEDGVAKSDNWQLVVTAGPPRPPTGLTATKGSEARAVRLSWTAVTGAESYAVYRSATASAANASYLGVAETPKYSDTTAVPGRDYWYFVKARNGSGTSPDFSEGVMGWRALAAPENIVATDGASADRVGVSWSSVEGATHYRVFRAGTIDGNFVPVSGWIAETEFFDQDAMPGAVLWYAVQAATDAAGTRSGAFGVPDDGFRAVPVVPSSLFIDGAGGVVSGGTSEYAAYVVYSDGSRGDAPTTPTWTISAGSVSRTGVVTAPIVSENTVLVLSASTTADGVPVSGSKSITVTASAPVAPTDLRVMSATAAAGISLAWGSVPGASSYILTRTSNGASSSFTTTETGFTDGSATAGVLYSYRVAAANAAGIGAQSTAVEARIPLLTPTGVSATRDRTDGIRVAWNAVAGATHYRIARAETQNGTKTELGSWTTARAFIDTPPSAGTSFFYFVAAATDASGANASGWSEGVQGLMKPTRTLLSLFVSGPDRVAASAAANYSCAASYSDGTSEPVSPSWSVTPAEAGSISADGTFAAAQVGVDTAATVTASFGGKVASKPFTVIAPEPATATVTSVSAWQRWPFSGLVDIDYSLETSPAGTRAAVLVSAFDEDLARALPVRTVSGDGVSSPASAGLHRLTWNLEADCPGFHAAALRIDVSAVPSSLVAPTGLKATGGSSGIALAWNAAEDALSYEVWRNTTGSSGSATRIATPAGTNYTDSSASPGTRYYYWVKSVDAYLASEFSSGANAIRPLSAPTGLSATSSTESVVLSWTASSGASSYEIWRHTADNSGDATKIGSSTSALYTDSDVTPGTRCYYWVKAVCLDSTSGFSAGTSAVRGLEAPVGKKSSSTMVYSNSSGTCYFYAVSWNAVPGATSYRVYINDKKTFSSTGSKVTTGLGIDANSFARGGIWYGAAYFWIQAIGPDATSAIAGPY